MQTPEEFLLDLSEKTSFLKALENNEAYLSGLTECISPDCICAHKAGWYTLAFEKAPAITFRSDELLKYLAGHRNADESAKYIVKFYNLVTRSNNANYYDGRWMGGSGRKNYIALP